MSDTALFDLRPATSMGRPHISVLPCSVVDVSPPSTRQRRDAGGHAAHSSRQQYSHFPIEVGDLCFQLYLRDCHRVFDPFAGWGERGSLARTYGKDYEGIDISHASIEFARKHYEVVNTHGDARTYAMRPFDSVLTCPPYWRLERYSPHGLDAAPDWSSFLAGYRAVWTHVYQQAQIGRAHV